MDAPIQNTMYTQLILAGWNTRNKRFTQLLDSLTDEQLLNEIAPGRNTGVYLMVY